MSCFEPVSAGCSSAFTEHVRGASGMIAKVGAGGRKRKVKKAENVLASRAASALIRAQKEGKLSDGTITMLMDHPRGQEHRVEVLTKAAHAHRMGYRLNEGKTTLSPVPEDLDVNSHKIERLYAACLQHVIKAEQHARCTEEDALRLTAIAAHAIRDGIKAVVAAGKAQKYLSQIKKMTTIAKSFLNSSKTAKTEVKSDDPHQTKEAKDPATIVFQANESAKILCSKIEEQVEIAEKASHLAREFAAEAVKRSYPIQDQRAFPQSVFDLAQCLVRVADQNDAGRGIDSRQNLGQSDSIIRTTDYLKRAQMVMDRVQAAIESAENNSRQALSSSNQAANALDKARIAHRNAQDLIDKISL